MSQTDRVIGNLLIGQRIVTVRNLTPQELRLLFCDQPPARTTNTSAIVLENSTRLVTISDEEINNLGVIGIITPNDVIYTVD